jgi:prevent-host-death family protein
MEERQIGTTELRQRLTDVIQAVKEEKVAYVVETFGRPQVVIVDASVYRQLLRAAPERTALVERARAAFGMWRERDEIDDEWLSRSRRQWYSAWQETENRDE